MLDTRSGINRCYSHLDESATEGRVTYSRGSCSIRLIWPTVSRYIIYIRSTNATTEKKIRKLSLLQQQALSSAAGLFAQDLTSQFQQHLSSTKECNVTPIVLSAVRLAQDDLPIDDANIILFVSGYIRWSISRRRKCSACRELLVNGNGPCNIDDSISDENKQLFLLVGGGGLCAPSKFT